MAALSAWEHSRIRCVSIVPHTSARSCVVLRDRVLSAASKLLKIQGLNGAAGEI